ncbi:sensor histidine kinase [uncultured Jatrophihabitans sp.]|uniref:sensor histidine kinase n=1 Tax=uncultured Jatrophihabitans sp. TaxID=1610747 RepID=UPI0035CB1C3F
MSRLPELVVGIAALAPTVVSVAVDDSVHGPGQWTGVTCLMLGALLLAGWRTFPLLVLIAGPTLLLGPLFLGPDPGSYVLVVMTGYAALAAERFSGRAAWWAGGACLAYLVLIYGVSGDRSIGPIMLTLPGFLAGTALRLRRETGEELAERGLELELERELFTELTVRNERARIAAELHDIVGHALSVMVVQAAAGQRLVDRAPDAASASLSVIAQSARQGRADLQRLIDLLVGTDVASPDLALLEELVAHAARGGLLVTLRFEGDRDGVDAGAAHLAYRIVQESLTNALRHAQGTEVRVLVRGDAGGRSLTVRVENDPPPGPATHPVVGGGRGLVGLRERVDELGGTFSAGPGAGGGWLVEATFGVRAGRAVVT